MLDVLVEVDVVEEVLVDVDVEVVTEVLVVVDSDVEVEVVEDVVVEVDVLSVDDVLVLVDVLELDTEVTELVEVPVDVLLLDTVVVVADDVEVLDVVAVEVDEDDTVVEVEVVEVAVNFVELVEVDVEDVPQIERRVKILGPNIKVVLMYPSRLSVSTTSGSFKPQTRQFTSRSPEMPSNLGPLVPLGERPQTENWACPFQTAAGKVKSASQSSASDGHERWSVNGSKHSCEASTKSHVWPHTIVSGHPVKGKCA
mmetsp:Transcript_13664/g.32129  ORF Transcript_13664/g.32129 Transcript_13664/m.32129 type:complete len:255 (+) Transcript_13664:2076-2840(+)